MDVAIETAATILRYNPLKARQREAVKAFMQGNVLQTRTNLESCESWSIKLC